MNIDWSKVPLRKPLAVYSALLIGVLVSVSVVFNLTIPEPAADLLRWLGVTCVGGYYATSTIEATKK